MPPRSMLGSLAAAAALVSLGVDTGIRPAQILRQQSEPDTEEKISRQRKRWLQRQARKQTRKHRK
jgi:hypothetical protein